MNPYLGEFEDQIVQSVKQAGQVLMERWPGNVDLNYDLQIEIKSDGSKVTDADLTSNEIIVSCIKECFPDDLIFSEELPPPEGAKDAERVWIIDPLDGTHSYIRGCDDFSILVALCSKGIPQFSIALHPARAQIIQATRGQGTFCNGRQVFVSDSSEIRKERLYIDKVSLVNKELAYKKQLDSGFVVTNVCTGVFDGSFLVLGSRREWDLAAPALLITESGGVCNQRKGRGDSILSRIY